MKQSTIRSVCECQSQLEAVLDEQRLVLAGFAIGLDRVRERAPAHTMEAAQERFDVGWLCPICGRNTLRSFSADSLVWRDAKPPSPAAAPPPQAPAPLGPGPSFGTGTSLPPRSAVSSSAPSVAAATSPLAQSVAPVTTKPLSTPPPPPPVRAAIGSAAPARPATGSGPPATPTSNPPTDAATAMALRSLASKAPSNPPRAPSVPPPAPKPREPPRNG